MQKKPDLDRLKLAMAEKKLTFEELAEKTGLPRLHLVHLFEGEQEMKASEILLISNALELSDAQKIKIFCH